MRAANPYATAQKSAGYCNEHNSRSAPSAQYITKSELSIEVIILNGDNKQHISLLPNPVESPFYQIIYLTDGHCNHIIDFDQYQITTQNLGFVLPGQISQLIPGQQAQGYIFNFTAGFLKSSAEKSTLINPSSLLQLSCLHRVAVIGMDKTDLDLLADNIAKEYFNVSQNQADSFRFEIVGSLLNVFLLYLSRISYEQTKIEYVERTEMTENFFLLLEEKYKIYKTPADFATELKVSPGYLNEVLKKKTGFTTTYYISQRIMMQAKRLMFYSDFSMKQIAYDLGFEDLSHFSKLFKRVCGLCFTDFKRNLKGKCKV